ncbi:amidohydrolase family protein [Hydrogenophaga sp.]|uniref:amidohydrolase family protein n=1 Tax=Hydrogenophaga sp. TaxID=1904254 RepID=UPI003F70153B
MSCGCIDVHTHIVPAEFPRYVGSGVNVPWPSTQAVDACHRHVLISGKHYRTINDGAWSTERRMASMADTGIERQVLSPMPELLSYWLPTEDAKVLIRYINEQIAEMVAAGNGAFIGFGAVPLQDVDAAIVELEHAQRALAFQGIEIASHVNGVSIGDPRFVPFFQRAAELGMAIFVHALRPAGKERIVGAFAEQVVCFPGDIALAAASMITGGTAQQCPDLRIAFSHGGGAFAMLLPRLVQAWKGIPAAHESLPESPGAYARKFFFDSLVFSPTALRFLVETVGDTQVFVGSDFPFGMSDKDPVGSLRAAGFDDRTTQRLMRENAIQYLKLETTP